VDKKRLQEARDQAMEFALVAGAEMAGIYEATRESASPEEVADRLELDLRAVRIVLNALVSLGLLSQRGNLFRVEAPGSALFLRRDNPEYAGSSFRHSVYILRNWMRLSEVLQTGKPVQEQRSHDQYAAFMRAMDNRSDEAVQHVVDRLMEQAPASSAVLDLGGGPGRYARAFAKRADRVVLFDLPPVVDHVKEAYGLDRVENLELCKGDMAESLPEERFDVVFLGHICHMWSPEENRSLLQRAAGLLVPGGVFGLVDFVRGHSEWAPLFAVNMLVNTPGGNTYTFEEYKGWLEKACLVDVSLEAVPGRDSQLVLARKPQVAESPRPQQERVRPSRKVL